MVDDFLQLRVVKTTRPKPPYDEEITKPRSDLNTPIPKYLPRVQVEGNPHLEEAKEMSKHGASII